MSEYGSFEYGGVKFTRLVPQEKITQYIASLSDEKRGDVEQVVVALEAAGLLTIEQTPPAVTESQERQMGYAQTTDAIGIQNKQYEALESLSPTLSQQGQAVGDDPAQPNQQLVQYEEQYQQNHNQNDYTNQSGGVYNPPTGMTYIQTPQGSQTVAEESVGQSTSRYIGQPPAPPRPGSISASLRVDPNMLRRG